MSRPAQNARPSPDNTTARRPFSRLSRSVAPTNASNISASSAFILSARTRRTSAIPSEIEIETRCSMRIFLRVYCFVLLYRMVPPGFSQSSIHLILWEETMFRDQLLAGRRILVTGGGTGLGKAMAARFLQLGAEVHICGRRKSVCDETATELMDLHGGRVMSYGVDIRDAAAVDEMIETIFKQGPLTDLINNAAGNFISRTEDLSPRASAAVANTVMRGTFYVTHAVGRRWIAAKQRGNVVSITVTWVRNGSPYVVPSAMSK